MEVGFSGVLSEEKHKRLCNAGFSVASLNDLTVLLHDWLLIDKLAAQLWNIAQDIRARREELEREWNEEADALKISRKETSQKSMAVGKPRLGGPSIRRNNLNSSRQHPIADPRMSTPAMLHYNTIALPPSNKHLGMHHQQQQLQESESIRCNNSTRQHPIVDPRLSTPAMLCYNAPALPRPNQHLRVQQSQPQELGSSLQHPLAPWGHDHPLYSILQ
jgi:hypothetical protein